MNSICRTISPIFTLFISLTAAANDSEKLMQTADIFAACSGKYEALAIQFEKENMPKEIIDNFKGNMRGAKLASAVMIKAARNEAKNPQEYFPYIESIAYPHQQKLALSFLDPSIQLETVLTVDMAECTNLNPLQAKIINDLRKQEHLNK